MGYRLFCYTSPTIGRFPTVCIPPIYILKQDWITGTHRRSVPGACSIAQCLSARPPARDGYAAIIVSPFFNAANLRMLFLREQDRYSIRASTSRNRGPETAPIKESGPGSKSGRTRFRGDRTRERRSVSPLGSRRCCWVEPHYSTATTPASPPMIRVPLVRANNKRMSRRLVCSLVACRAL